MKIVYVISEAYPFVKTGGLADVGGSFPKFVAKEGLKVIVCLPLYKTIDIKKYNIQKTDIEFYVELNQKKYKFQVYKYKDNVKYYFFKNNELFGREGIYGDENGYYKDNYLRFGAFSCAIIEFLKKTGFIPDIIHLNNWETSLISPIIKTRFKNIFINTKIVLTIHNLLYQGIFPKESGYELGFDKNLLTEDFLLHKGKFNFIKGGIIFSDAITTVSPTYMKEICTPEYGAGLDQIIKQNCHKLYGILNGIDYSIWNPEKDPFIYENYSYSQILKKEDNKKRLLEDIGLSNYTKPLITFVGKFKQEHGIDLLLDSIKHMSKFDANFLIFGIGEKKYNNLFSNIGKKYKNVYVKIGFNEEFSRKVYAGGDFLLRPSIVEPCGISQMIGMRYANIIIARKTGGLADTVKDLSESNGYGILFKSPQIKEFLFAVERALNLYKNKEKFQKLRKYVSTLNFSWEEPVAKYIRLYESLKFG